MSSRPDLPSSTSTVSTTLTSRFISRITGNEQGPSRRWLRLLAGAALPAALLVSQIVPSARSADATPLAVVPGSALSTALGAFVGDAGLSDADLAAIEAESFSGEAGWGAPLAANRVVRVAVDAANLRRGPGTAYQSLGKLDSSMSVTLLSQNGDWYKVRTQRGTEGWMAGEVLQVSTAATEGLTTEKSLPAKPQSSTATTIETAINVRKGPGTSYASLGKIGLGVRVDLLGLQNGWYKVQAPNGVTGWVLAKYLRLPEQAASTTPREVAVPSLTKELLGYTTNDNTRLRQGPGTGYNELMKFDENLQLKLLAKHGSWYQVETPKGNRGWVSGELLSVNPDVARRVPTAKQIPALPKKATQKAVSPGSGGSAMGRAAARVALNQVGKRYVWGAVGPRAFDCSGLLVYAYRQQGLWLPHKASMQFSTRYGKLIRSMSALQPGDMLFFKNTAGRGITHAAMYVGNGMMVSANSPKTGVRYQTIHTRYWRNHWAGAIRPYAR